MTVKECKMENIVLFKVPLYRSVSKFVTILMSFLSFDLCVIWSKGYQTMLKKTYAKRYGQI